MNQVRNKTVGVIVAHPDDETLWAGGLLLSHPEWKCFVISLCRRDDENRAPKFKKALELLHAKGIMGDLDDGPEQTPLPGEEVELKILELLPALGFDLVITHSPGGEYTRHLRHEEIGKAVINLWDKGLLGCRELWNFAYEDGDRMYFPRPVKTADVYLELPEEIWQHKYHMIKNLYGFGVQSWEAETTPKAEAFWRFFSSRAAVAAFNKTEIS
jgi:LmbE family N-acetylglucosaminyl deacetylase